MYVGQHATNKDAVSDRATGVQEKKKKSRGTGQREVEGNLKKHRQASISKKKQRVQKRRHDFHNEQRVTDSSSLCCAAEALSARQ